VALTATRNEDWVLGLSLRVSLSYCDAVVITDHRSNDRTAEIIEEARTEFPDRQISVQRNEEPEWMEMDIRQEQLERGRRLGGTHFVIADADEVPTGNLLPRLRDLALTPSRGHFVFLPTISTYHTPGVFRWDGFWGESGQLPWSFCDTWRLQYKVRHPYQLHRRAPHRAANQGCLLQGCERGGLFHLQFINKARLQSKAVWYKMTETLRYPGTRSPADLNQIYDWTLRNESEPQIREVPDDWWAPYRDRGWLRHFSPDAVSWQQAEIHKLVAQHGLMRFNGLDLHGLV
jgi:hypothetical protein